MAHLGYLLTALADGQLSAATTEKVLEHVAACPPCAAELAAERRARRMLAGAECEAVGDDLAARLRTIGLQPASTAPVGQVGTKHSSRRGLAWAGLGSVIGASTLAACLFVVGTPQEATPIYSDSGALASLGAVADAPADGPSVTTGAGTWGAATVAAAVTTSDRATMLGDVFTVTAQRPIDGGEGVVVELAGRQGHVVLAVQRGRLDAASVAHLEPVELFGASRYVLTTEPWHAVWQSGGEVVELVTDLPPQQVAELVAHFPAQDYDADLTARLSRGWSILTEGWSR